ncbi:MAG: thioredoxin domain-containing protein [Candidatus Peribacteraceae bacterium]|nr:thioredoxin domain-containing protein [Candidatus Peribacteraceae bacterium]
MRAPRLFCYCLLASVLCGCTFETGSPREPIEPDAPLIEQPATQQPADTLSLLRQLEGTPLSASGTVRFLSTGILELGKETAPLTLTVFTEYHCAYCNQFYREFIPRLERDFIENGKLKVRFVPFVIRKYPHSEDVLRGFLCAGTMGEVLRMQTLLVNRQEKDRLTAKEYGKELGMDANGLQECMQSESISSMLSSQKAVAENLGVTLVPTFFLETEERIGLPEYADMRGWIRSKL